jgi:hypothetical protein
MRAGGYRVRAGDRGKLGNDEHDDNHHRGADHNHHHDGGHDDNNVKGGRCRSFN